MVYKFAIVFAIIFTLFIIWLVRNKKLHEKYSILWLILGLVIIILSFNYDLLDKISIFIGIYYSPAFLFLIGIVFIFIYIIHLSTVITKTTKDIIRLNQELAITNKKLEDLEKQRE